MMLCTGLRQKLHGSALARCIGSWATVDPEQMSGKSPALVQNFGMVEVQC